MILDTYWAAAGFLFHVIRAAEVDQPEQVVGQSRVRFQVRPCGRVGHIEKRAQDDVRCLLRTMKPTHGIPKNPIAVGVSDRSTLRRLTCAPRAIPPKRARNSRAAI